jgi:DNA (cytosine-5)-methyltransferase 1
MKAIDLFAGLGGFTEGARYSRTISEVLWAANHNQQAVKTHEMNHRGTIHSCQDLHQANWEQVPEHNVTLASPCCQGHSKARGKERSHHDTQRSTAWAVVSCAEVHRPQFIVVENVVEFLDWELYPAWSSALKLLGYTISPNILDAADLGIPQHRIRVFIICTRSKSPLIIPQPKEPHVPASTLIIDDNRWSPVNKPGRAEATLRQIENGRKKWGPRFLVAYYGNEKNGRSLDVPLGTVSCKDRFALVDGDRMRLMRIPEYKKAMSFRDDYILTGNHKDDLRMLGNSVPPVLATYVLNHLN